MDEHSGGFALPIEIRYRHPRWLPAYMLVTTSCAIGSVLSLALPVLFKTLLVLLVSLLAIRESLLVWHDQIGILLDIQDHWLVLNREGRGQPARLVSATISMPGFIVLVLRAADSKRYPFILTSREHDSTLLRRLRTRLYFPLGGD